MTDDDTVAITLERETLYPDGDAIEVPEHVLERPASLEKRGGNLYELVWLERAGDDK